MLRTNKLLTCTFACLLGALSGSVLAAEKVDCGGIKGLHFSGEGDQNISQSACAKAGGKVCTSYDHEGNGTTHVKDLCYRNGKVLGGFKESEKQLNAEPVDCGGIKGLHFSSEGDRNIPLKSCADSGGKVCVSYDHEGNGIVHVKNLCYKKGKVLGGIAGTEKTIGNRDSEETDGGDEAEDAGPAE